MAEINDSFKIVIMRSCYSVKNFFLGSKNNVETYARKCVPESGSADHPYGIPSQFVSTIKLYLTTLYKIFYL